MKKKPAAKAALSNAKPRARAENAFAEAASTSAAPQALTSTTKEKLRQMVARIETLSEEKAGVANDIKEAYAEAKTLGYDTKALRKVIALRKLDANERVELENMIDLYRHALGDI
ncbi:MAG: DUF2312 domain-containing protein [Pseudomonadota bacterium]